MMHLSIFAVSSVMVLCIHYLKSNFPNLIEHPSSDIRKVHNTGVIRIGGIIFFSIFITCFYLRDPLHISIIIFSFLVLAVGLIEDVYRNFSKYYRLFILGLLCCLFVINNNFIVLDFDSYYLNYFFNTNFYFKLFFSIFGLLLLINAFNFVDGLNGLLLGISLIILGSFAFYASSHISNINILIYALIIPTLILFCFNFFGGRILSGDSGSYFLGFMIGAISINMSNYNILESFEIACILFYPTMEIICSVIRRLIMFSNPLKPDGQHLHQLLFHSLSYKLQKNKNIFSQKKVNSLSSFIILLFIFMAILLRHHLSIGVINDMIIFFLYCFIYLILYNSLLTYCFRHNLFNK